MFWTFVSAVTWSRCLGDRLRSVMKTLREKKMLHNAACSIETGEMWQKCEKWKGNVLCSLHETENGIDSNFVEWTDLRHVYPRYIFSLLQLTKGQKAQFRRQTLLVVHSQVYFLQLVATEGNMPKTNFKFQKLLHEERPNMGTAQSTQSN